MILDGSLRAKLADFGSGRRGSPRLLSVERASQIFSEGNRFLRFYLLCSRLSFEKLGQAIAPESDHTEEGEGALHSASKDARMLVAFECIKRY